MADTTPNAVTNTEKEYAKFKARSAFNELIKKAPREDQKVYMDLLDSVVFKNYLYDYLVPEDVTQTILPATSHSTFTGLGEDDHTQYLLADGTRELTGDWDAGSAREIDVGTLDAGTVEADDVDAVQGTFGDGTNEVALSSVGLYLNGTATMWDDLRFPISALRVGPTKVPGFAQFMDDGAGSAGVFLYWFDAASEEQVHFIAQMPHRWAEGTDIEVHCHWTPSTTAASAGLDVCWGLEYTWSNINGTFGNTAFLYGDEQTNGATETLTADKHYLTELGTITGTGKTLSSCLVGRFFRDATGSGGTDDYPNDAGLLEVDFHYQIDSLGSKEEYVKGP